MEQPAPVNLDDLDTNNQDFLKYVKAEILEFLESNKDHSNVIMLFPPFNGYKRMLVHNLVESAFSTLSTFSIGAEPRRRIVICGSTLRKYVLGEDSADKTAKTTPLNRPRTRPTLTSDVLKVISRNLTSQPPAKIRSSNSESRIEKTPRKDLRKTAENQPKSADRPRKTRTTMSYYVPPHMRKTSLSESEPVLKKEKIVDDADVETPGMSIEEAPSNVDGKPIDETLANLSVYQLASSTVENSKSLTTSSVVPETNSICGKSDLAVDLPEMTSDQPELTSNPHVTLPPSNVHVREDSSVGIDDKILEPSVAMDGCDVNSCQMDTLTSQDEASNQSPCELVAPVSGQLNSAPSESLTSPGQETIQNIPASEWDPLYCGKGPCSYPNVLIPILDRSEMGDIETEVGRVRIVEVKGPPQRVDSTESTDDDTHYVNGSIVEIYDLPDDIRTEELAREFDVYVDRGLRLRWIDRNTALGIFASSRTAEEVLSDEFQSRLKIRPISQGNRLSQEIARHIVLPSSFRPKTCSSIAKRLLSGALGLKVSPEEMAAARKERNARRSTRDQRRNTDT
ncbi:unnamed protein product, partial [Nesidiocoris tenuis]